MKRLPYNATRNIYSFSFTYKPYKCLRAQKTKNAHLRKWKTKFSKAQFLINQTIEILETLSHDRLCLSFLAESLGVT